MCATDKDLNERSSKDVSYRQRLTCKQQRCILQTKTYMEGVKMYPTDKDLNGSNSKDVYRQRFKWKQQRYRQTKT